MRLTLVMVMVSGLFFIGCSGSGMSSAFGEDGLPKQQYYVGGGFHIDYRAQDVGGNVYVVEENSRKLLATKSLRKDEVFDLTLDPRDEETHMRLKGLGMDPLNLKFSLYFVPQEHAEKGCDKEEKSDVRREKCGVN